MGARCTKAAGVTDHARIWRASVLIFDDVNVSKLNDIMHAYRECTLASVSLTQGVLLAPMQVDLYGHGGYMYIL